MSLDHKFDWDNWIGKSRVEKFLTEVCAKRNENWSRGRVFESYPLSIKHIQYDFRSGIYNQVNDRYSINQDVGYLEATTANRDVRVKNYRNYYPDYGGTIAPLNLGFLQRNFQVFPSAQLDKNFKFFLLANNEVIAHHYIDLSMGISQDGTAACYLTVNFDEFFDEYWNLHAITSNRSGKNWQEFREKFEYYVERNENIRVIRWWGKGYELHPENEDIPF